MVPNKNTTQRGDCSRMINLIITVGITVVAFIIIAVASVKYSESYRLVCAIFLLLLAIVFVEMDCYDQKIKEEEELTKILSYTVYLDGNEVDADKIDFNYYQYTINDDKKEVYMTKNQRN